MRLRAYCIYDRKVLTYHAPFFAPTDGSALRSFLDLAQDTQTNVGRHPEDYSISYVGEFDDEKGHLIGITPEFICNANTLLFKDRTTTEEAAQ